jgi:hypothetical protein
MPSASLRPSPAPRYSPAVAISVTLADAPALFTGKLLPNLLLSRPMAAAFKVAGCGQRELQRALGAVARWLPVCGSSDGNGNLRTDGNQMGLGAHVTGRRSKEVISLKTTTIVCLPVQARALSRRLLGPGGCLTRAVVAMAGTVTRCEQCGPRDWVLIQDGRVRARCRAVWPMQHRHESASARQGREGCLVP